MRHGGRGITIESARNQGETLRQLLAYLKPYTLHLVGVFLLVVVSTLLTLAGPLLVAQAIDRYIVPGDLAGLTRVAVILLAVYIASSVFSGAYSLLMVHIGQKLILDMRSDLFRHLQTLSMSFFDQHETGDLMSRITNDTDTINRVLSSGVTQLAANLLQIVGIFIAMIALSWQLALSSLVILPLMAVITGAIASRSRSAFRDVQRTLGTMNASAEENIAGVRVVQAFAREKETIDEFRAINRENRDAGVRAQQIVALLMPLIDVMSTIAIAIIAGLGGWLTLRNALSIGVLVAFITYVQQFFHPLRQLSQLYNQLQSALAGAERVFEIINSAPTVADKPGAKPLPPIEGRVTFEHVTFGYEPDKPVLVDVSLTAEPGQTIALVGPTGAGKTTIINLLSRFYDVQEGAIRIDGYDIRDIQQESLRRQLGIVLQDTYLFSGTVMDNIRYGRLDATDEEVIEAAKLANADQFICRLPQGYQTVISEQGSNFSQGQRQLIAIARAILADPAILILDEATSSVDTRTEMHIQEALQRLMQGRTSFVIAHRLSTIENADQVLVVNDNRIIERGSHRELLEEGGFYHDLYMSQYRRLPGLVEAG